MTVVESSPRAPDLRPLLATCSAGWDCCTVAMLTPPGGHPAGHGMRGPAAPGTGCHESGTQARRTRRPVCHGSSTHRASLATISVVTGVYRDWYRPCQPAPGLGSAHEHPPDTAGRA